MHSTLSSEKTQARDPSLNGGSADVEDGGALLQQVGKGAVHADDDQQPATGESASFNASNNQQQPYLEQQ